MGRRPVKLDEQAAMLANRLRKNFRRLHPRFERQGIGAFRLYDRDIPEIRAAVDWYEGHVVLAEYAREQTSGLPWLQTMARAAAEALSVPPDRIHLKSRHSGEKYARLARIGERIEVRERDLRFLVNLDDYIEAHVHGPLRFATDVEALVLDPCFRDTEVVSPGFLENFVKGCESMVPLNRFLAESMGLPW